MSAPSFPIGTLFDRAPDLDTDVNYAPLLEASIERATNVRFMPTPAVNPDPPRKTLRGYLEDVDAIASTIEALDAEDLTNETRDELSRMLVEAITGTKRKIDNATQVLAMFEHLETAALAECARLTKRAQGFQRRRERLEGYLLSALEASGLKTIEGDTSAIAVRVCPEKVVVDDELALPAAYWREPPAPAPVPDKTAIKEAIKAGTAVPGAHVERGKKLVRS